jgi:hypothetical protein
MSIEEKNEIERQRLAKCYYYHTKPCEKCPDKFKCFTQKRLKLYEIYEDISGCRVYHVFADNEDEAQELFEEWDGYDDIITYIDDETESSGEVDTREIKIKPKRKGGK